MQNLEKDTSVLGTAEMMEEIQIGSERYNLFTGCPKVSLGVRFIGRWMKGQVIGKVVKRQWIGNVIAACPLLLSLLISDQGCC